MYATTTQHLNYNDNNSDTSVSLKQGQGHKNWYALVDPKQGHNRAMFANSVYKKANV